jgi:ribosome-associated protein
MDLSKVDRSIPAGTQGDATDLLPSKTKRKQEADRIKTLAKTLLALSASKLQRIPLDPDMREELMDARKIRSNVARKRQMQFVAKLLRRTDTTPVLDALDAMENEGRLLTARHHRAEMWRDHLLATGDEGLSQLLTARHDVDIPAVRTLLRNAQREAAKGKPTTSSRTLFRLLRDLDENDPLPGT